MGDAQELCGLQVALLLMESLWNRVDPRKQTTFLLIALSWVLLIDSCKVHYPDDYLNQVFRAGEFPGEPLYGNTLKALIGGMYIRLVLNYDHLPPFFYGAPFRNRNVVAWTLSRLAFFSAASCSPGKECTAPSHPYDVKEIVTHQSLLSSCPVLMLMSPFFLVSAVVGGGKHGDTDWFYAAIYKIKNGNPLCILILFYGDRIQHRRELALHFFFGNLILQCSSPMCIIEPCPLMMLSLGHYCVFLGPFVRVTEMQFFPFYRGKEYD